MSSRPRAGFTMLEAVVALAIIGMVCVGVLGAYSAAARADVIAAERLPLVALAEERVQALDLALGALDRLPDSVEHGAFGAPYQRITWETTTRRIAGYDGLFEVVVTVRDGDDRYTLRTRRVRAGALR